MAYIYTWIPIYNQVVSKLTAYRNRQQELIEILKDIGINIPEDEDLPEHKVPLNEIDPFSFLFYLGSPKNEWNKVTVLRKLISAWDLQGVIYDTCGIPTADPRKLRMFSWQYARTTEVARLWDLFTAVLNNNVTDAQFKEVLKFPGTGKVKLTEAFFIVKPDRYLCLNGKVKPFLESLDIRNTDFDGFSDYMSLIQPLSQELGMPFHEISFKAHLVTILVKDQPSFYRIGTTEGENGPNMLPVMLQEQIVSIGWPEIGDLNEIEPFNRLHVKEALQNEGYYAQDNRTASRKAGEIVKFKDEIGAGDYVVAAEGQSIRAIGKVISPHCAYDKELDFPHIRCVKWIKSGITDLSLSEGLRTTVWKYEEPDSILTLQHYIGGGGEGKGTDNNDTGADNEPNNKNEFMYLNQILYGPPGTGKTYTTIDKSLEILGEDLNQSRLDRKILFSEYQNNGKIYFTTFHQNLAYEDFIEGIKPLRPEEDQEGLSYDIQDGLFMRACIEATYDLLRATNRLEAGPIGAIVDYNNLFDELYNSVDAAGGTTFTTITDANLHVVTTTQGNLSVTHEGGQRSYTVSRDRLAVLYEAFPDPQNIQNIVTEFRQLIGGCNATAYWSVLNRLVELRNEQAALQVDNAPVELENSTISYEDKRRIVHRFWDSRDVRIQNPTGVPKYVFIIDEINRGNVSQIFGELITLIEEDKRIGNDEALYAELPYSKRSFGVPCNLFIMGTMNTADRSVEALDTALRRRFTFKEMLPKPELISIIIDGINLSDLLNGLNARLHILKDKDHSIGHAWFWNVRTIDQLRRVFADKILPLLKEYFYNDYEKMGLLLGEGFFEKPEKVSQRLFAKFPSGSELASQYEGLLKYQLKDPMKLVKDDFGALIVKEN